MIFALKRDDVRGRKDCVHAQKTRRKSEQKFFVCGTMFRFGEKAGKTGWPPKDFYCGETGNVLLSFL